ncbi:MAG TPA: hypothetical protein VHT49_14210 [Acidimicrobiales bacterium]|nr:hypothetical protein [Acidimicrobiales bacterium]
MSPPVQDAAGAAALVDGAAAPRAARMRRAAVTATNSAPAFAAHSASSDTGSLSATMPAPACTLTRPSGMTTMVRIAMAVSTLPEKSM